MDFQLKGRVAAITGASSGLGRRFALKLSEEGAAVAVMAKRKVAAITIEHGNYVVAKR